MNIFLSKNLSENPMMFIFCSSMIKMCESNQALRIAGVQFVQIFQELMQRLLEYRDVVHDEIRENKMSCTVNLLVSDDDDG